MDCWYKDTCKNYQDCCANNCIRYAEMEFLMDSARIPRGNQFRNKLKPSQIDVENFKKLNELKKNVLDFVVGGNNLYIYSSNFGNGKTTWSIKIMQSYFDKIWAGNGFVQRGLFVHVPSFLTKFKEVINKKDEDFEEMKEKLIDVDLVIWDDIASGKLTDFDHTNLLTYIDQRKLNGKSNIYTGNLCEEELVVAVGNRLKSRIWNDSLTIEIFGSDRRIN